MWRNQLFKRTSFFFFTAPVCPNGTPPPPKPSNFFNLFLPVSKKNENRRKKNVRMLYIVVEFSSKPNLCFRSFILLDHVIYCINKIATDCAEINPLLWKWFWWYCIAALTPLILWLQELMGQDFSVAQKQKLVFAGNNVSRFVGIWKEDLSFEHFQVLG